MTLIDYLNRVHFAENILEEAVWSELDRRRDATICTLSTKDARAGELGDRIRAGLPREVRTLACDVSGGVPTETEALRIADFIRTNGCSVMLAYGRGYVINLAKAARLLAGHGGPIARFSEEEGGGLRITGDMPDLIAIPALQGFTSGFNGIFAILLDNGTMIDIASRALVPTVTIGDPAIARSDPVAVQASAGVNAITYCAEALLSPNYNPPANGIALDGLSRGLQSLRAITPRPDLQTSRELMAACMNASMLQQRALGLTHALTSAFCGKADAALDKGAVKRVLLPRVLGYFADAGVMDDGALANALGARDGAEAAELIERAFAGLPLPDTLSATGIGADLLADVAERATRNRALANCPARPNATDILAILHAAY